MWPEDHGLTVSFLLALSSSETVSCIQEDLGDRSVELSHKGVRKAELDEGTSKSTMRYHLKPLQILQGTPGQWPFRAVPD